MWRMRVNISNSPRENKTTKHTERLQTSPLKHWVVSGLIHLLMRAVLYAAVRENLIGGILDPLCLPPKPILYCIYNVMTMV
jgi:hypothetical protein